MPATERVPSIRDEAHLEDLLSEPSEAALAAMRRLSGDVVVLGVAGKMGPSLARMIRRASETTGTPRRILGVARFSTPGLEEQLKSWGIETIRCDLLDPAQVERLPDAPNVVAMTGMKFGSTGQAALTWAMNTYVPALVCRKYRKSRIVAFSTGNVYGLSPVTRGGSSETDALNPVGEYSISALGRERMYEYFSRTYEIPMAILRLNYATEMRYGVLVDIAQKVQAGEPVDLAMGHLNALWQADANAMALAAFDHLASPPFVVNLAGPELLSVRQVAEEFGRRLGRPVSFHGSEAADALLSNAQLGQRQLGSPRVKAEQLIAWIADWVGRGGRSLGKPTHFESRDGKF